MSEYKCDYCNKELKPTMKRLICLTQGNLICSVSCLTNFYDINWIRVAKIPSLMGEDDLQDDEEKI